MRRSVTLNGKYNRDDIRAACGDNYTGYVNSYGCFKDCKGSDGKTVQGGCGVTCTNDGNCTGTTPERRAPRNLRGIAGINAVLTNKSVGTAGTNRNNTTSLTAPTAGAKGTIKSTTPEKVKTNVSAPPPAGLLSNGPTAVSTGQKSGQTGRRQLNPSHVSPLTTNPPLVKQ